MAASFLAALGALALLTITPGPDVAVVTRFSLTAGLRAGARAASGVVAGLAVWGLLTVVGLAALLAASSTAYTVVRVAGAVVLVVLGLRLLWPSARRRPRAEAVPPAGSARPARTGFLTNVLNPKTAVFSTALLPSLVPAGGAPRPGPARRPRCRLRPRGARRPRRPAARLTSGRCRRAGAGQGPWVVPRESAPAKDGASGRTGSSTAW